MHKRFWCAVGAIALVCGVLGSLIFQNQWVVTHGEVKTFAVRAVDPYDIFRGRYVAVRYVWETDAEHQAVRNLSDRYYLDEHLAPKADALLRNFPDNTYELPPVTVSVAVLGQKSVVTGIYVGDERIEDYLQHPPTPTPTPTEWRWKGE